MSLARFQRPLVTADVTDTVEGAARAMRDQCVGCLVVTKNGRPYGLVTDRDLVVRILAAGLDDDTPLGAVTTFGPLTLSTHDTAETAARSMKEHGVRRLPIVDEAGTVVGIVTADDLLMMLGRNLADLCDAIENRSDSTDSR